MTELKKDDVVGFIFAQPGNDRTYMLINDVRDDEVDAWDLVFDMPVTAIKTKHLWLASERELDEKIAICDGPRNGTFSYRELAEKRRRVTA
jgi:hypothetical protein